MVEDKDDRAFSWYVVEPVNFDPSEINTHRESQQENNDPTGHGWPLYSFRDDLEDKETPEFLKPQITADDTDQNPDKL